MLKLSYCPTCGSDKIKAVKRDLERAVKGVAYTVPALEFHECPACGEKVFDPEAMRKIQAHSPSFAKPKQKKRAA
ncbi:MAG: YgiT-type zinc finger protein [Acidobacteria bacterium]|nr:YgiT-type zinc finger protein [Acidobacteriota bacterium]MBI3424500.1 YgiT-type zinc finger protein [Acidobacteriota bacterium]